MLNFFSGLLQTVSALVFIGLSAMSYLGWQNGFGLAAPADWTGELAFLQGTLIIDEPGKKLFLVLAIMSVITITLRVGKFLADRNYHPPEDHV